MDAAAKRLKVADYENYTVSRIYGACQMGLAVDAMELSPCLIDAIAEYVGKKAESTKAAEEPPVSLSELRREQKRRS